jgi:hypothetical protein
MSSKVQPHLVSPANSGPFYPDKDLWIAPSHSLKWRAPKTDWELRPGEAPPSNRFLELADIALGLKAAKVRKKKRAA